MARSGGLRYVVAGSGVAWQSRRVSPGLFGSGAAKAWQSRRVGFWYVPFGRGQAWQAGLVVLCMDWRGKAGMAVWASCGKFSQGKSCPGSQG